MHPHQCQSFCNYQIMRYIMDRRQRQKEKKSAAKACIGCTKAWNCNLLINSHIISASAGALLICEIRQKSATFARRGPARGFINTSAPAKRCVCVCLCASRPGVMKYRSEGSRIRKASSGRMKKNRGEQQQKSEQRMNSKVMKCESKGCTILGPHHCDE